VVFFREFCAASGLAVDEWMKAIKETLGDPSAYHPAESNA
jgi:hypothetical protein